MTPHYYADWNRHNYLGGKQETYHRPPDYLFGEIQLYPRREDRWVYLRDYGWTELNFYYKVHKADVIRDILEIKTKTPLLFWGTVRDRFTSDTELKELSSEFNIVGFRPDKSRGRHSYIQASLSCSNALELQDS